VRARGNGSWRRDQARRRAVTSDDPAVKAGRLAVEVMTWMVPAGNVHFENVRAPRSMAEAAED
jgi:hypothetical protein